MLDIKFIRENQEAVKKAIKDKGSNLDLPELLEVDEKRRSLKHELDELRREKKEIAKSRDIEKGKALKQKTSSLEESLANVEKKFAELMYQVPNIPSSDTPVGGEEANKEIKKFGKIPKLNFEARDHITLGKSLGLLDLERGVKVAGFRGYFLTNEGALMHYGVLMLALQKMVEKGFSPMVTPTLVREFNLFGSGHFPGERQEIYEVEEYTSEKEKENKFLVGTAEPALLGYRADEVLDLKELPVKICGISPCYRKEVGGYGKDTKGVLRVHEFMKVEQVVLCENDLEKSVSLFEELNNNAKELLDELELPYRVIQIATGDMGMGKYKMYDIETWMPAQNAYRETHSNSHLTDWQARRLNIRYRDKSGEVKFVHTLNNTAIASPRILVAILENYQQKDGSVKVPKALQKFVGKKKLVPK